VAARIAYVDGPRLARSLFAAADWVAAGREEINRINVFPVPDGDTGTNFSLTLRAVADALRALGDAPLPATARTMARASVLGARGNSGMMLAHFLMGFAESVGDKRTATVGEVAAAIRGGADKLEQSLDEPREGTILTVAREAANSAERAAAVTDDIGEFMLQMLRDGEVALARTPELMAVLKQAGVVDAGGMGFVRMLEGVVRFIEGDPILPAEPFQAGELDFSPAAMADVAAERDFHYCTEVLVRGEQLPPANEVRQAMHAFGGSLGGRDGVRHPEDPCAYRHPPTPSLPMQRAGARSSRPKPTTCGPSTASWPTRSAARWPSSVTVLPTLPDAVLDRHHIALVPLQVIFGDQVFRDRLELKPEEFYRRLRAAKELPTTSQPTPGEFVRAFRNARDEANEAVVLLVSGTLSGTFQSANAALKASGIDGVHLFDSRSASLGLGMLGLRASELAEAGWNAAEIVKELGRIRGQSGMFLSVDTYDNLIRSGRVSRGKAWLGGLLDVKPILTLTDDGRVAPADRVRGRDQVVPRVLSLLERKLTPRPGAIRFGIAHADAPEEAERLRNALVAVYSPKDVFVSLVTGVIGTHVGFGAWAVFYQVEDGTPARVPAS
jgi:DegV family protein with EDD domain